MLTVGQLLDEPSLALELVSGGDGCRARRVVGAHSMETGDLGRWLEPDWVLLTVGMRLENDPAAQRRLVAEALDCGLAAIGFGVGVIFDAVPAALLDEARRRGLAVFTVPVELPFRAIVDHVNRTLLSENTSLLQRSMSSQQYLMDGVMTADPRRAVLARLGELLQSPVVLYRHDGTVLLQDGDVGDVEALWHAVCLHAPRLQRFEHDGRHVLSAPVVVTGAPVAWLVAASTRASACSRLGRETIRTASRLLAIIAQARVIAQSEERGMQASLLTRLLDGDRDPLLSARLGAFGIDFAQPAHVIACALTPADGRLTDASLLQSAHRVLERVLVARHIPHLVMVRGNRLVALVQADDGDVERWLAELAAAGAPAVAGVGRACADPSAVADSWRDAQIGLDRIVRGSSREAGTVVRFAQFELAEWLLAESGSDRLTRKASDLLGQLRGHPELYQTLVTYLRANLNATAAARALHLHPNSMRYRLKRIEELLGRSINDLGTIVDLYLALQVEAGEAPDPAAAVTRAAS